jgi:endonuclease/exonuclease/phosphatase family metal-dependent hydrolase
VGGFPYGINLISQEIYFFLSDNQEYYAASDKEGDFAISPRLRSLGRKIFRFPVINSFRPHVLKSLSVTRALGKISMKSNPDHRCDSQCDAITVISANLWHDFPLFRRLEDRLEAFARLAEEENADILLLQEVARKKDIRVDEWLAQRLGMSFVYSRANGHGAIGFEEGLAILSRYPIKEPRLRQLSNPDNPFVRRAVLGVSVETPCGDIRAYSVHLGLGRKDNRIQQALLRQLVDETASMQLTVVGGDFNTHETSPQIKETKTRWLDTFRHLHPTLDGHTHSLRLPWGGVLRRHRLDYIFLLPNKLEWNVIETRHISTPGRAHSDHCAVLTRLAPAV